MSLPTFREVFKSTYQISCNGSIFFTGLYTFLFILVGLELSQFNYSQFLNEMVNDSRGSWLIGFLLLVILVWNFITFVMGFYLIVTSFVLSRRYGRFLLVMFGVIFFLGFFRLLPSTDVNDSYRWFTSIYIRIIQGLISTSMILIPYGLVQGLIIFIVGKE
jgi:hypothetical protein